MSDERQREILDATQRAMDRFRAKPHAEQVADLQRIGILDEAGLLSSRFGGTGAMTGPETVVAPAPSRR